MTSTLAALRLRAGLTQPEAARLFGRSVRSWRRWEAGARYPIAAPLLLRIQAGQFPGWPGFNFAPGALWTPAGQHVSAAEIEHLPFLLQFLTLDELREWPEPAQI